LVFRNLIKYAWKRICQQFWLLAVLSMLFFALPLCVGPVAESLLSQGVDFSGMTLAVVAPEGDSTGRLIEELTLSMRDVSRYATLRSMNFEEAARGMEDGSVTAILVLPENFVGGVLYGENPDVVLVVSGDRPLESLLTLWVGQSAADLLTSAQQGIYAVLELYPGAEASDLSWDQVHMAVNMEYIGAALNRQELFRVRELRATGSVEPDRHYTLSLLIFLTMALPPLLMPLFAGPHMAMRRRLRTLGYGAGVHYGSTLWVCCWVIFFMTLGSVWFFTDRNLAGGGLLALFGGIYGSVCCLLCRSASSCGALAFGCGGLLTFLSGGILPTALLPGFLRSLGALSPVGMLRRLMNLPVREWLSQGWALPGLLLWCAGLLCLGVLLYKRRLDRKEERL